MLLRRSIRCKEELGSEAASRSTCAGRPDATRARLCHFTTRAGRHSTIRTPLQSDGRRILQERLDIFSKCASPFRRLSRASETDPLDPDTTSAPASPGADSDL